MVDHWLGIGSTELDSHSGEEVWDRVSDALDGTGRWGYSLAQVHWFVIDLGQTYNIGKVRGRSLTLQDPTVVNIYLDDNNPPTTLASAQVGGITNWQDTDEWVLGLLIRGAAGRYIKVEIVETEHGSPGRIGFGSEENPFTIFDAYGDVAAPPPVRVPRPTAAVGNPYMF